MAHILIVDDDASTQILIRIILESADHSVDEAWDGTTALDILKISPNPFDLIILDLRMPKMDGFELLSILQNQSMSVPVMILSAHSDKLPQALESMVHDRLLKPFSKQELLDAVNNLLGEGTPTP